ncbi:M23 family metallopeptidase [Thermosulfuriphilus ammonigenes]|uniref:M23 family metallopeptidase n=1 Tax=Thermosulfuriphilus ammonigenes TaxID=1936021 RepID=A0A6G7PVC5_9BACT|nr:M23 family metallopeptidase [Thermosulfuriphilus ammonigenes]MBA2848450.1 murein DD-endopeptidase MepM/ murein hydrolase activator NlpD [Thermosulfuriphilus ammonigenes]QIJ71398.1 M23 family metallopeptidase [Thermosulfuriphilus ammonigenes]
MKRIFGFLLIILLLIVIAGTAAIFFFKFESTPPQVSAKIPQVAGKKFKISFQAGDEQNGLRKIVVLITQGKLKKNVFAETYPVSALKGSPVKERSYELEILADKLGLREGEAQVSILAWDGSWSGGLKGNLVEKSQKVRIDLTPPRIIPLSFTHNIRQGGANLVVFKLEEPVSRQGVVFGKHFFKGYPTGDGVYVCYIALPYNLRNPGRLAIQARDLAGNESEIPLNFRARPMRFKKDRINISDRFLTRKMPEFLQRYPQYSSDRLIEVFLKVNRELRAENNRQIREICTQSVAERLWKGAFLRLPRSATRSTFADHRYYYYRGRKIDEQYHLGIDLASVAHAPVPAANTGKVVFANYLGIYGNTVIIDHGQGLFSMYSHLSSLNVSPGQKVNKGEIIGHTGMTGLAGGDHLHYAMLVQGIFVDPLQWWDSHWIDVHIESKLQGIHGEN